MASDERGDRSTQRTDGDVARPAGEESHDDRAQHVELDLDRQRPEVAHEGRPAEPAEVRAVVLNQVPVGHAGDRGVDVAGQAVRVVAGDERHEEDERAEEGKQRGAEPAHPALGVAEPADSPGPIVLAEQDRRQ